MFESRLYREVNKGKENLTELSSEVLFAIGKELISLDPHSTFNKRRNRHISSGGFKNTNISAISKKVVCRKELTDDEYRIVKEVIFNTHRYAKPIQRIIDTINK